jgi:Tol biopolymer transport system component
MDEERIERALRQGPPDEPAYERSIAAQVRTASADSPDSDGAEAVYRGAVRRAGVSSRFGFAAVVAAVVVLAVALAVVRLPAVVGPGVVPSVAPSAPAIASASPSASAEPTMRVDESWIAYEGAQAGDGIYLVRPDGADPHALLPDAKYDAYHPDWSPDGAQIAFDTATSDGNEIWVVNADGTNAAAIVRRSTDCAISCGDVALPAWSPDGSKIAFVRFKLGASGLEAAVIEVQDVASGDRRVLFTAPSKTALNYPRWSSDGRSIVFEMTRYPDTQIYLGTATGSAIAVIDVTGQGAEPVVLTDWSMYATYPDWRPGSDEILFSTYDLDEFEATDAPSNLYTIKPDGSGQTALTTFGKAEQRATQPTWTPDGSRIIFTLVGRQAGIDNPLHAAFIDGNGSNIEDIGVVATHPRLRP